MLLEKERKREGSISLSKVLRVCLFDLQVLAPVRLLECGEGDVSL